MLSSVSGLAGPSGGIPHHSFCTPSGQTRDRTCQFHLGSWGNLGQGKGRTAQIFHSPQPAHSTTAKLMLNHEPTTTDLTTAKRHHFPSARLNNSTKPFKSKLDHSLPFFFLLSLIIELPTPTPITSLLLSSLIQRKAKIEKARESESRCLNTQLQLHPLHPPLPPPPTL